MASLHTWAGLIPGWILFLVFVSGTASFFRHEISAWMRPELTPAPVTLQALQAADALLATSGHGAPSWSVMLPNPRGGEALTLGWPPSTDEGEWTSITLDPVTGSRSTIRETEGGDFLFHFHYNLRYLPWWVGRYLIVIASLAMLVAILSGIITHKKIFTDFFLLRFGKGQRSWLDAHNVTSVLALPFHLMITYTGLVIFANMLLPWPISANFASEDAYFEAAYPSSPEVEKSGRPAATISLVDILDTVRGQIGQMPASLSIQNPGDAAAVVTAYPRPDRLGGSSPVIAINGVSGTVLKGPRPASGAEATRDVMVQLHAGWFAAPVLRWLYFLAGLSGTVMTGSGLILWTVKRRAKLPDPSRPHFGFRLVERLNIGVIAGSSAAIAVFFLANRLLPVGLADRASWEVDAMFIAWGALFVWAIGRPARRAWVEVLTAGAVLYAMVPAVNALTTSHGLLPSLIAGDWIFAGFDLVMLSTAALLALAARRTARQNGKPASRRQARVKAQAPV
ncbi:PepSY-associated TM helix domain-containing protein [Novosphingobium kaempferiae]|uniref:PepSY-associated TM helix domain-containing protein n=1 Tax=Novosphingobium kaempferiae TaxID=2896849 RepID=UPI001E34D1F4|nr:PepSY-associated TM helix domain-containing protein [Novosphingobium kaempferiae]